MTDQLPLWPEEAGDGLRWSISRDRRLRDCARRYYLFHFASRGGHTPTSPPDKRRLFVLKTLRNRFMWVGEVVHSLIELAMGAWQRGEDVPVDALIERGTRTMRVHYSESVQGLYWDRPLRSRGLIEHEYREDISREEWRAQRDHMELCMRNFFALPMLQEVRELPRWRWLAVESHGRFELDGATIVVRPDFAWRDEDDRVVMVDWKTGYPRHEHENLQLAVYGMFAKRSWGFGAHSMRAKTAYLATGEVRELTVDLGQLEQAEHTVRLSLEKMRSLHGDDPTVLPPIDRFTMTDDLDNCSRCGFRRVCGR